jgi:cyanophycinase
MLVNRLILSLLLIASSAFAQERLIVLGGSLKFPKEAVTQFAEWAQGKNSKVLVIPWATQYPDYVINIQKQLRPYTGSAGFLVAPTYPMTPAKKALFLKQLEQATGVFFTGGDQERILKTIDDKDIRSALSKKFNSGIPFAGTSAGTAIMSNIAIIAEGDPKPTGEPDLTIGHGLCFLPSNVIVDQHFIVRDREARLRFLMLANPGTIGVGIDEPAGFIVEDGVGRAIGPSNVVILTPDGKEILNPGDKFDLNAQKRVK